MSITQIISILALVGYVTVLLLWLSNGLSDGVGAILMGGITIVMAVIGASKMRSDNKLRNRN
jgi:hypothetical protein